jgi:cell wall-associated NlpC family hydrolase
MRNRNVPKIVVVALAVTACLALVLTPARLWAQPGGDLASKSQQAAEVSREINSLDQQLEVTTESFNRAQVDLDTITGKVDQTQRHLELIKQSLRDRRSLLDARAVAMYENGPSSLLEVLLDTKGFTDFLQRADYVYRVTQSDADLVRSIKGTRDSVAAVEQQLSEQQRQQRGLFEQVAAKKSEIEVSLADRQNLLNSINQEIQQLLAQQQQSQLASEQALNQQARNAFANVTGGKLGNEIAKAALQFLGVPYQWAASGPDAFDCSGLTMYVYKEFGIDLPHNAAMQYNLGTKIPLDRAGPGDLVFFGMPPHHVAIYLGNNLIVEAPHTGDVVKVSNLSSKSDFSGVCRYWP